MRKSWSNRSLALPDVDPSLALVQAMRTEETHRATFSQQRAMDASSIEACSTGASEALAVIEAGPLCPS